MCGPQGTAGPLTPAGCCRHPPAQADSSAAQGDWGGGTCARALPRPRGNSHGCTSPGLFLHWVLLAQSWGKGQRYCLMHVGDGSLADLLGAASPGMGSTQVMAEVVVGSSSHRMLGSNCPWAHTGPLSPPSAAGTWTSIGLEQCPMPRRCGKSRAGMVQGVSGQWNTPKPSPDCAPSCSCFQLPCDAGGWRQCTC